METTTGTTTETTTLEEYKNVIRGRFNDLSDEEKTIASDAADSPVGDVIRKLFGPEMSGLFGAERTDQPAQGMPTEMAQAKSQPMGDQMQRAGLGAR